MVRRLVEEQDVGARRERLPQEDPQLEPAGQDGQRALVDLGRARVPPILQQGADHGPSGLGDAKPSPAQPLDDHFFRQHGRK